MISKAMHTISMISLPPSIKKVPSLDQVYFTDPPGVANIKSQAREVGELQPITQTYPIVSLVTLCVLTMSSDSE